ncbi:MAG TPA: STAS domain-containing protein, partial [Bacteroidales bacterium]|nr:STAS domain-containing protein [Bacteroidales bacterium]
YARLIPMSTLAGILVVVAYNMSEWRSFKALFNNSKSDVAVLLTTFFLTVLIDLTVAIQFGLLLAVLLFLKRVIETTDVAVLNMVVEAENSELADEGESLQIPEGVEVFEVNGPFFFGIANKFEAAEKLTGTKPKVRIIRLRRVPFIDSTGLSNLKSFIHRSAHNGIQIVFSGAGNKLVASLNKAGIIEEVGEENNCVDIQSAIERAVHVMKQ